MHPAPELLENARGRACGPEPNEPRPTRSPELGPSSSSSAAPAALPDTKLGRSVAAATVRVEAADGCDGAAIRIESGVDSNGNGLLDEAEVSATETICEPN